MTCAISIKIYLLFIWQSPCSSPKLFESKLRCSSVSVRVSRVIRVRARVSFRLCEYFRTAARGLPVILLEGLPSCSIWAELLWQSLKDLISQVWLSMLCKLPKKWGGQRSFAVWGQRANSGDEALGRHTFVPYSVWSGTINLDPPIHLILVKLYSLAELWSFGVCCFIYWFFSNSW